MELDIKNFRETLNKAFLVQGVFIDDINLFKENYLNYFNSINTNDNEETLKDFINIFLRQTYFKNNFKIKENISNIDLVIYNGKNDIDKIGVIIETKALKNSSEMITKDDLNKKSFHELITYYLEERVANNNLEIKHLIITNSIEWFIFDALEFEKLFYHNKLFLKTFNDWHNEKLVSKNKEWFYNQVVKPFVKDSQEKISSTHFTLSKSLIEEKKSLIELYKIFSPEHLLKLPFQNDSNTLNQEFYNELLHIIGLYETKDKLKKIERLKHKDRNEGSILESVISIIETDDLLQNFDDIEQYGDNYEEQLFSIALELSLTWLNRLLFLKLFESQIVRYNNNNSDFSFLNNQKIKDFDELKTLFFEVLAIKPQDRKNTLQARYNNIPYLNSSLFELTLLEKDIIKINHLKHNTQLPIYNTTVLKDSLGKRKKGELHLLTYIFEFLDSYNFSSDTKLEIQEHNKTVINSSVLGLIFEKLNGYKDGSFFTPGFITMYICRETIRKTLVQKFNSTLNWNCESITDIHNQIIQNKISLPYANEIFNSVRICDPAVGSGHFLVSALNELIAIKSELGILIDKNGHLLRYTYCEVQNDELYISHFGEFFTYNFKDKESQRIQETIFNEKRTIIEKCLFGVDINPKSVQICRLRLWIELLKNAYYIAGEHSKQQNVEMETLPNIDINIKTGNSLVNHFTLNGNGFSNGQLDKLKQFTQKYKENVELYKNTQSKKEKQVLEKFIIECKEYFSRVVKPNDSDYKKIKELETQISTMPLFFNKEEQIEWKKKIELLSTEKSELEKIYQKKRKEIYYNSFEWRYEFPEVLDDNGFFVGFDAIIGNPPYIGLRTSLISKQHANYYKQNYKLAIGQFDTFSLFIELSHKLLNKTGFHSFIVSKRIVSNENFENVRKFLINDFNLYKYADAGMPFESVNVESNVIFTSKHIESKSIELQNIIENEVSLNAKIHIDKIQNFPFYIFPFAIPSNLIDILKKINNKKCNILGNIVEIKRGFEFGYNHFSINKNKIGYKIIKGENIKKYVINYDNYYVNADFKDKKLFKSSDIFCKTPKLVTKFVSNKLCFAIDEIGYCNTNVVYNVHLINTKINLLFLLGLLNSKVINFWFLNIYANNDKIFPHIQKNQLESIPIIEIENKDQQPLVKLVDKIMKIKNKNPKQETSQLESEIDKIVYKLYDLTDEEIELIEKNATN